MATLWDNVIRIMLHQAWLMLTFLNRSATSTPSIYPIVHTMFDGYCSKPIQVLIIKYSRFPHDAGWIKVLLEEALY